MAEIGFDIAPLLPHSFNITVDDASRVLLRLKDRHTILPVPFSMSREPLIIDSTFTVVDLREMPTRGAGTTLLHDVNRTAVDVLIAAEVYRRLSIFLADFVRNTLQDEDGVRDGSLPEKDVLAYFDLANSKWNEVYLPPAFDVIDITFDSSPLTKAKLRELLIVINILTAAPAPVVAPPVLSATVQTALMAATPMIAGAHLGYQIVTDILEDDRKEQQQWIYSQLLDQVQRGNYRGIQSHLGTLGYYRGKIDNKIGPISKEARSHFARSQGLDLDIAFDDPAFLLKLSEEVTRLSQE